MTGARHYGEWGFTKYKQPARLQPKKVTDEAVLAAFESHAYLSLAARSLEISPKTLSKYETRLGIRFKRFEVTRPKFPIPPDFAEICPTMGPTKLAAHYGVSRMTITRWSGEIKVEPAVSKPVEPVYGAVWARVKMSGAEGINGYRFGRVCYE